MKVSEASEGRKTSRDPYGGRGCWETDDAMCTVESKHRHWMEMGEVTAHGQQQPAKMLQSPGRRRKGSGHRTSRGWKRSWTLRDLWVRPIRVWLCKDWEGKVSFSFLLGYWAGGGHLCRENNSVVSLRVKAGLLEMGSDETHREQDGESRGRCGGGVVGKRCLWIDWVRNWLGQVRHCRRGCRLSVPFPACHPWLCQVIELRRPHSLWDLGVGEASALLSLPPCAAQNAGGMLSHCSSL